MVYLFLADGFEEVEALTPLDYLRRAGIPVTSVGIGTKMPVGSHGIAVQSDCMLEELPETFPFEMLILPGGLQGTQNLAKNEKVKRLLLQGMEDHKKIAAICAAPSILGELGLLNGKRAVCYPGFESKLKGAQIMDTPVVVDETVVTAIGAGAAQPFSFALIELLAGKKKAEEIASQVQW